MLFCPFLLRGFPLQGLRQVSRIKNLIMKKFSIIFYIFTICILLLWIIPFCINYFNTKNEKVPFTLYSTILGDFVYNKYDKEKGMMIRSDFSGNSYSEKDFDALTPQFKSFQLVKDGNFPDSIKGIPVSLKLIRKNNFYFRSKPADILKPVTGLYILFESQSGRIRLSMPGDVFRFTKKGIQFINAKTNIIEKEKSDIYTSALLNAGFKFPMKKISGDPNPRKDYDEGFIILDSENKLYHLKQIKGMPYVREIPKPKGLYPKYLFITEFKNHRYLAFFTDIKNNFYVININDYSIKKVGIKEYNPEKQSILIVGNLFDWTFTVSSSGSVNVYAVDAGSYELLKKHTYFVNNSSFKGLHFKSNFNKYISPVFD